MASSTVKELEKAKNMDPVHDATTAQMVFLFTGQGSQWYGMGRELISTKTVFGESIRKSDAILNSLCKSWALLDELQRPEDLSLIDEGHIAIPATTAIQIALVDLLKSLDILPNVVLGHSTGEISAAYAAGILDHHDALTVAFCMGDVLRRRGLFDGRGGMLAVGLGEAGCQLYLDRLQDGDASIACENSPWSTTVSGDYAAIKELESVLCGLNIFNRRLRVPAAYHSHQMKSVELEYLMAIEAIGPSSPQSIQFFSSVTGRREVDGFGPLYWARNAISAVAYSSALREIIASATKTSSSKLLLVEIGPQPHLQRPTEECMGEASIKPFHMSYFPSLVRGKDAREALFDLAHGLSLRCSSADLRTLQKPGAIQDGTDDKISRACNWRSRKMVPEIKNGMNLGVTDKHAHLVAIQEDLLLGLAGDETLKAICQGIADEILKLIGASRFDCQVDLPVSDYGLDSLLATKLAEWVNKEYALSFSVAEILDSSSLFNLARSIEMSNSLGYSKFEEEVGGDHVLRDHNSLLLKPTVVAPLSKSLPRLPLPDLKSTLENYYRSIEAFGSDAELSATRKTIEDFRNSEDGRKLQGRLQARVNDPTRDCWLADLYNGSNFLDRNGPLVPYSSFFYTHKLSNFQHTQAERAAIITAATLQYKEDLESGAISPDVLHGQPSCTFLFKYLFNTTRKPRRGSDEMERFPGNDYIVVLRRGRAFVLPLYVNGTPMALFQLEAVFEWILQNVDSELLRVGILTSDERTSWAKIRENLKTLHPQNSQYLHTIEAAAFLVCLDDASPSTPSERAHHFHFGDGSNRWNDKSVQFAVCTNGVSGFIGDHSMLDAGTVLGLNRFVTRAILKHTYKPDTSTQTIGDMSTYIKEVKLLTTPYIDLQIARVTHDFNANINNANHVFLVLSDFGDRLCRLHKYPPKSLFQLIVVLASKFHFGCPVPAFWETVSLGSFYKGRVEINQVITLPVLRFLDAAQDVAIPVSGRQQLLQDAAKSHAASVMKAVRGRGVDRHITSLRQMVEEGETVPALFTDPLYVRARPRKIMSHCHETGMEEKGFLLRDPQAIWVHYEISDESVKFSITGLGDSPRQFCNFLEHAALVVRELVVA
ncbi:hypothetical protein V490_04344 [Pseudogymnoascus sp. VKM F-3557]|nr:hypothetical protein V490_04344 [Pseudogymnoascus sp. VKM F-3557]